MPSMPLGLWGDEDGSRYRDSYFGMYPGIWRQGDWIAFSERGSCVVTGRSDATLNRGGVRLGTGEFYGVVEELPEIADSLVVHLEDAEGGAGELLLFVVLAGGARARRRAARRDRPHACARSSRRATCPIRSMPCPRSRARSRARSSRRPSSASCAAPPVESVASRDALLDPSALDAFVLIADAPEADRG